MNEQSQNLKRVTNAIAHYVIKFIDEHEGKVFSNAELHKP